MKYLLLPLAAAILTGCANLSTSQPGSRLDGSGYPVEVCAPRYAGVAASCQLSGAGSKQVWRANLISDGKLYIGGALRVGSDGKIEATGCQVANDDAVVVDCPGALLSAGLINLHEHIDYSYQQPPQPPKLTWQHRHEWRKLLPAERGFEGDAPKDPQARTEVSERAMLRHALSGTTALAGAKDYRVFLRNLKLVDGQLATPAGKPVTDNTFPLNDARSMQWPLAPCTREQLAQIKFDPAHPYVPHVGEGTNDGARHEIDCVLDAIRDKASPSAFIHAVAVAGPQLQRLAEQKVAVVASPRSNFQLYGRTAPLAEFKQAGVNIALGTDWSPSGSLTELDEARCLARYNRDSLQSLFSGADIHRMMTENAAAAVGLQGQLGKLAVGEQADFVLFDTEARPSLGAVLEHSALRQTLAVFIGGRAASLPSSWAGKLPQLEHCMADPRDLCGQQRTICGAHPQRNLAQLLQQATYTIDDAKICQPQPTNDCVLR
ncbi:amidohydrolase family protein [Chitinimonas sp. JJ19]|uniref:amidohydrolase family protein n=1 Tax=Chitinimonas sp. JJ19 TaxID=3109352 RepID=UPI003000FFF0